MTGSESNCLIAKLWYLELMIKVNYILCGFLWITYVLFGFSFFPIYNINVGIPSLALFAIVAWIMGTEKGLLLILLTMPFQYFMLDRYGDILEIYQAKLLGATCIPIVIVLLVGSLKQQRDQLKKISQVLDERVKERTDELNKLIQQLIADDEKIRRDLGQDIHDGLGQNLTGLLLFSNSLQNDLNANMNLGKKLLNDITEDVKQTLELARKISRTLFPLKMVEAGFDAALDELFSYFHETSGVELKVNLQDYENNLTEESLIHVYRIVYECILNTLHLSGFSAAHIYLRTVESKCSLTIDIMGCNKPDNVCNNIFVDLIHYRVMLLGGQVDVSTKTSGRLVFNCTLRNETLPTAA